MKPFKLCFFLVALFVATFSSTHAQTADILLAKHARPLTDVVVESTPERIERGRYLANGVLNCFQCHGERDDSLPGHPVIEASIGGGHVYADNENVAFGAPNLTPDKETGAGNWTDDMLARAIREGVGHDGRALSGFMPFKAYQHLSDDDLHSVVVYLRSLDPIQKEIPKARGAPAGNADRANRPSFNQGPIPHPDMNNPLIRGEYLVKLGNCADCHTANVGPLGGGKNQAGANGPGTRVFSTNLSSHATGVGNLTPEAFAEIIRTGKGGTLDPKMPWHAFRNINDEDFAAMLQYLKTTEPVNHQVLNRVPPTFCGVCGETHGLGEINEYEPLTPFDPNYVVPWDIAGEYRRGRNLSRISQENGQWMIAGRQGKPTPLVAVSENAFQIQAKPQVYSFEVNDENEVVALTMKTGDNIARYEKSEGRPQRTNRNRPARSVSPDYQFPWDIAGKYQAGGGRNTITLAKVDGQWVFTGRNTNQVPIVPISESEFSVPGEQPSFSLELGDNNEVAAIIVSAGGREFRLPRMKE